MYLSLVVKSANCAFVLRAAGVPDQTNQKSRYRSKTTLSGGMNGVSIA